MNVWIDLIEFAVIGLLALKFLELDALRKKERDACTRFREAFSNAYKLKIGGCLLCPLCQKSFLGCEQNKRVWCSECGIWLWLKEIK